MSWNEADRAKYDVIRARYSSDMSEAEFALIAPLLPPAKRRGRKLTDPQAILVALFYMTRCACPWRDSGLWTQIVATLVMGAREAEGREVAPTAVVFDSRSAKTTEAGGPRGLDARKKRRSQI